MSGALLETWRGAAYPAELDHMGHMNVQYYSAKFDQGTWQLFSRVGITSAYLRQGDRGMAAVDQHTRYLVEVMAGDLLVVRSAVLEIRDKLIHFRHRMYNCESGAEVANTELKAVHMDLTVRKSCPFPDPIRQRCRALLEQQTAGN